MSLSKYYKLKVRIVDTDGDVFVGKVNDYIEADDNVPEEIEGIIIDTSDGQILEFTEKTIKSIEIIK